MKGSQAAQFKRTNIKVIKASAVTMPSQGSKSLSNNSSVQPNAYNNHPQGSGAQQIQQQQRNHQHDSGPPRVINVSMFALGAQQDSSSLGPPAERTPVNQQPANSFRNMSQEPQSVRQINGKQRQLTFGSVKKVIKTINTNQDTSATYAPDQIASVMGPSTTTTQGAAKHKLYLPKKNAGMAPSSTTNNNGVQLQDGHRRRLQALAASQHGVVQQHHHQQAMSAERSEMDATYNTTGAILARGGETSTYSQVSANGRMKVISKKLITMSKSHGRNAAHHLTEDPTNNNVVCHMNIDKKKSASSSRPSHLNLNFSQTTQPGISTVKTTTNQTHHGSALARFNQGNSAVKQSQALKQGGTSVLQTHRQASQLNQTSSGTQSVAEQPSTSIHPQLKTSNQPVHYGINIRQEVSPNRTAYNSQPTGGRKYASGHPQGGSLCHRRHQIIQDITDDTSPSQAKVINFGSVVSGYQRPMAKQSSDSSMKSLKQMTQALNKQSDLKKVFYAKISQSPSNKSLKTMQSNQSSGGPPSSQPSQQFTLTKKASLISQEASASTSRERTLNFKLKKHGQHGQLQNHKEQKYGQGAIQIQQQQYQSQQNQVTKQSTGLMPSVANKRRPLVIRKNNFVLTKQGTNTNDSGGSLDSGNIHNVHGNNQTSVAPGSTTNASSAVQRILINPLTQGTAGKQKLNVTLHSNNSGNRALNNTQKIGRAGQGHGVASNESMGSEASLSQTKNQLGKSIAAANASIKKASLHHVPQISDLAGGLTGASESTFNHNRGSSSHRKLSDQPSLEKLQNGGTSHNSQSQQPPGSRLIKVNRSKKKLDTARRSRIQQLKDINIFDQSSNNGVPCQQPQTHHLLQQQSNNFSSTLQSQSRGIPQLNKNNSSEVVKNKLTTPNNKQILQVQTDFKSSLPMHVVHKPAGSITIKAEHMNKQLKANNSLEKHHEAAQQKPLESARVGNSSAGKLKGVTNLNVNPSSRTRAVRNSQKNGLRPVRLFNYATSTASQQQTTGAGAGSQTVSNSHRDNSNSKQLGAAVQDESQNVGQKQWGSQREKDCSDKQSMKGPMSKKSQHQQPTPTSASAKSQKSLRRGQIFRKQTRKNSQAKDEMDLGGGQSSMATSKENMISMHGGLAVHDDIQQLTHMTTPTDAQNVSSTHLPLKNRRSNNLLSQQRQPESDRNQQSSYFQSSSGGEKANTNTSKPDSRTNKSGNVEPLSVKDKPFLSQRKQILKQFDSDPTLIKPAQQQISANELTALRNDHSQLIVPTSNLISSVPKSSEQIIPAHQRYNKSNKKAYVLNKSDENDEPNIVASNRNSKQKQLQGAKAHTVESLVSSNTEGINYNNQNESSQKNTTQHQPPSETVRRSLERVESIKNLLLHQDTQDEINKTHGDADCNVMEQEIDEDDQCMYGHQSSSKVKVVDNSGNEGKLEQIAWKPPKVLCVDSGRNSTDQLKFNQTQECIANSAASSSKNEEEPRKPDITAFNQTQDGTQPMNRNNTNALQSNAQQDQLRIQHNETLPPPGPSGASSNQCTGQYNKKQAGQTIVNKFSVTKGSDLTRELMTQTADTSNRKTISYARAYCNSSDSRVNVVGTAFSFKSQTSPDYNSIPQFPMSPQQAVAHFSNQLTEYEKKEIMDYPEIYFIGAPTAQKVQGSAQLEHNYGYDDDKGDYKVINNDHIGYRFEIKSFLGKGSFGTALKCFDHKNGVDVAVKVVKNKKKYYYQAGVELKILQFLKENDPEDIMNVIHLNDYVIFRKHLCIGFELMSMNLFEFLKINDFNGFDHNLIRRFAIQLLYALKYLKMFQIIHCDLKPENILLKESNKSGIKIIDFGSSTFLDERVYTYIQSRFYRAPEIMLGIPYDTAIDMWSFGCIMAELYIGYPIFPGDSENDQMSRLMEMVGIPDQNVLSMSSRKDKFFNKGADGSILEPIMCKNSRGKLRKPMGKPLGLVIGDEDPDFTDFVEKCLCWNPHERLSPDDALKHVWILKGLPPQVLIHHQKMHNIETPELPIGVLKTRNEFINEQQLAQKEQEAKEQQQSRNQQQQTISQKQRESTHGQSAAATQVSAGSAERAAGKIRLKRQTVQAGNSNNGHQTRNIQQQVYNTQQTSNAARVPLIHPSQSLAQPSIPTQQNPVYPGSTKSAHKAKSLGHTGKMSFKQQNQSNHNSNAAGNRNQGGVKQQSSAEAAQSLSNSHHSGSRKQQTNTLNTRHHHKP